MHSICINVTDFTLLSQLLRGFWYMEPGAAQGYLPLLNELAAGNFEPLAALFKGKKKENTPYAVALTLEPGAQVHKASKYSSFDEAPQGSVAVIPVMGPMMQQDFCGSLGTQTLGRLTQEADAHPNIVGHVFVFDTPGGTVAGTERFSNTIAGTQKPAVGYVQNMAGSAGYWSLCACNSIMLGGQTAMVGSIGTMLQYQDSSKADKKSGRQAKMVRADASFDKNEAYVQLLAGNEQPIKDQMLNPLNDVFLGAVQQNRAGKLPTGKDAENVLSGKMYLAADAVKYGLADSIGTFQDAVQQVLTMAKNPKNGTGNTPNSQSTMTLKVKERFKAVVAAIKLDPAAAAAGTTDLTEAHIEQLDTQLQQQSEQLATATSELATANANLATAQTALTAKETELATATASLTTAQTALTASTTKVGELTAEVARLGKQPGALGTNVLNPKAADETQADKGKNAHVDAKASHNQIAAAYFG